MTETVSLLQQHLLFGVTATVAAYAIATYAWRRCGSSEPLHPVLVATTVLALTLIGTDTSYDAYFGQTLLLKEALGW